MANNIEFVPELPCGSAPSAELIEDVAAYFVSLYKAEALRRIASIVADGSEAVQLGGVEDATGTP